MSLVYSETIGGQRHGIYLGGKADAKSRDKLQRWGVTHILNVTPPKEGSIQAGVANFFEGQFKYKRIPVYDASTSDLLNHANDVVAFISSGLCHGSVLVHCQRGVSRSATCVAFYLMRKAGMNLEDSMELIRQKRPEAEPIPAFIKQLQEYEQECIGLGVISQQSKRKCEDGTKPVTKKRKAIGPVGPPKRAAMIGPSLPPQAVETKKDTGAVSVEPTVNEAHEAQSSNGDGDATGVGVTRNEKKNRGAEVAASPQGKCENA